ncbi:MAG: replicative DNA helicase [Fusobacteriaceae bacterium]|jgi:replicative DNA helicase|nr:replicative DNA helicase [Fusobacteriaceae bacterium]
MENDNLKKLPSSVEVERALLCALFLAPQRIDDVMEIVETEDFTTRAHKSIYDAMLQLFEKNEKIDVALVAEMLRKSGNFKDSAGEEILSEILDSVPTAANILSYAQTVQDKARLRRLGEIGTKIVEDAINENDDVQNIIDRAERNIFKITESKRAKNIIPLAEALQGEIDRIDKVFKTKGLTGVSSGYAGLDQLTGGFQNSDLIIIAARPSMGKTAFALNIALNAAKSEEKHSVLVFSLEMSESQLTQRLLAVDAKIELEKIKNGFLSESDFGALGVSLGRLAKTNVYIADMPVINELEIRTIARRMKSTGKLDLIVIDYLQLIHGRSGGRGDFNRQQEISEISRALKGVARELDIPIIALSQLSRAVEARNPKIPLLSDLRESGSIEQDADIVMFLYRDDYYNEDSEEKGLVDVIIAKHRNGPTDKVKLRFFREFTRFDNYTPHME